MATKSPRQFHSQWPNVASAAQLPNVPAASIQDGALEIGDIAFVTGGDMYVCIDATLNNAVWQIIGTAAGSRDRRAPAIVVGNALAGDTLDDCDYVDPGDGSGIELALVAAAAGSPLLDVYIRPGTYDLETGDVEAPLVVPPGVTVRGAGVVHTLVVGRSTAPPLPGVLVQTVIELGALSELRDVSVHLPPPATNSDSGLFVVALNDGLAVARNVHVFLSGTWDVAAVGNSTVQGCIGSGGMGFPYLTKVIDCQCGSSGTPLPSFIDIGSVPLTNGLRAVEDQMVSGPGGFGMTIERLRCHGGDFGIVFSGATAQAHDCLIHTPFRYGAWITGMFNTFENNKIAINGISNDYYGVLVAFGQGNEICHNFVHNESPSPWGIAFGVEAAASTLVQGNRATAVDGWSVGVLFDGTSDENIANSNNMSLVPSFSNAAYVDSGANNDLAHNK